MIKACLFSVILLFINNLYYSQIFYDEFDKLSENYTVIYQDEKALFNQQQYNYNALEYEATNVVLESTSLAVISDRIVLDNQGGEHKDYFKLNFYENPRMIDDFVAFNRKIVEGTYPIHQNECIISQVLADKNNIEVGDIIEFKDASSWDITFYLKVIGIYSDNTFAMNEELQYTSRRNEVICSMLSFNNHSKVDILKNSNHVSSFFLIEESLNSPHAIRANDFYVYILNNIDLYVFYSLVVFIICVGLYVLVELFERIFIEKIIHFIRKINLSFKKRFKIHSFIIYIIIITIFSLMIIDNYQFINRTLIHYILTLNDGFSTHSLGYSIPSILQRFYVSENEQTVFNNSFYLLLMIWIVVRFYRINKVRKNLTKEENEIFKVNANTILVFKHYYEIQQFKETSGLFILQREFKYFSFVKKLYRLNMKQDDVTSILVAQLEYAKKNNFTTILVDQSIVDYHEFKSLLNQYHFHYILTTVNIMNNEGFKVLAYFKGSLITLSEG